MKHIKSIIITAVIALFAFNAADAQKVIKINQKDFIDKVWDYKDITEYYYNGNIPCVVDFSATWCGPCRRMEPILEELAKKYEGRIIIYQIDIDQNPEIANDFNIESIPYFLFFTDSEYQWVVGSCSKEQFEQYINEKLLNNY